MSFQRILIAIDGSHGAESATRLAGELAAGHDTDVLLVHAVPMPPMVVGVDQSISDESIAYLEDTADKVVSTATAILDEMGVKSESIVKTGGPVDVILGVAEERDVDAIVVGHRGHGAMKRFILGSVSSKLAHHARCAVVLAPVAED